MHMQDEKENPEEAFNSPISERENILSTRKKNYASIYDMIFLNFKKSVL